MLTTGKVFGFGEQLLAGERGEAILDAYFEPMFVVRKVGLEIQFMGVDRVLTHRETGVTLLAEYKTDTRAHDTGNVFVETVSNSTSGSAGWALSSLAQVIYYYVPFAGELYPINTLSLKASLPVWVESHPLRAVQNKGYQSLGRIVPIQVILERCCAGKLLQVPTPGSAQNGKEVPVDVIGTVQTTMFDGPA